MFGERGRLCCLWEVHEGCNFHVNVLRYTPEHVQVECVTGKCVPLWYCLTKPAVSVAHMRGGYLSVFVWVVGSHLAVSRLEAFIGIYSRSSCLSTSYLTDLLVRQ